MSSSTPAAAGAVSPYKLASVLLQYPTLALFDGLDELDETARRLRRKAGREAFARFLSWLRATPPTLVAEHYVETFDLRRRCALYLTYYRDGDTRTRGMSMLAFKDAYRAEGFAPSDEELPDYLPLVLDFADLTRRGRELLAEHRTDLALLQRALVEAETPYADVVIAISAYQPKLGRAELAQVVKAWEAGPPGEQVGLEPFAPPEYLAGYSRGTPVSIGRRP